MLIVRVIWPRRAKVSRTPGATGAVEDGEDSAAATMRLSHTRLLRSAPVTRRNRRATHSAARGHGRSAAYSMPTLPGSRQTRRGAVWHTNQHRAVRNAVT